MFDKFKKLGSDLVDATKEAAEDVSKVASENLAKTKPTIIISKDELAKLNSDGVIESSLYNIKVSCDT